MIALQGVSPAAGAKGGNQAMSRTEEGSTAKVHLAVDVRMVCRSEFFTEGTGADCKEACA
jgi:hypothetical protein